MEKSQARLSLFGGNNNWVTFYKCLHCEARDKAFVYLCCNGKQAVYIYIIFAEKQIKFLILTQRW